MSISVFVLVLWWSAKARVWGDPAAHWSFQPLTNPRPPATTNATWARSGLDAFILTRLEREGLKPSPEADRVTWLRRVFLDLTGLPPTPEDVTAFLGDRSAAAYDRVVERLLASPRYGERWGQHWLDVVRYADTHGFEVNTERPNAWPYRDYVIRALNADVPYDRFVREQLAGDALGQDAATGFLITASVLLPGQIGQDEPSKRLARQDALDEIVMNTGQTFLGMSLGCARCHDHKFDPISQRDYYAMQCFFAGVEYEDRELRTPEAEAQRQEEKRLRERTAAIERRLTRYAPLAKSGSERPKVDARINVDRFTPREAKRVRFTIRETNQLEPCLDEVEVLDEGDRNIAAAAEGTTLTSSGDTVVPNRHELRHLNDGEYGNSRSWMSNQMGTGWVVLEFPRVTRIDRVVWGRDRKGEFTDRLATRYEIEVGDEAGQWHLVADSTDRRTSAAKEASPIGETPSAEVAQLREEQKSIAKALSQTEIGRRAFAGVFRQPDVIRRLYRGDPEQPKEEMSPSVPVALGKKSWPAETPEQDRRLGLAEWIVHLEPALAARVIVNRVWQGHFGTGLVATPSDFGRNGSPPSHPELLEYLATEFLRSGWSLKQLHRLIVLSATYRQSDQLEPIAMKRDAEDRLLWRFPSRRLEAEALRDSMLAVSGELNLQRFGPGFDLFDKRGGLTGFKPVESFSDAGLRRLIYAHKVRREREAVFGAFDCPDAGQSTARRRESTTPIQALNLFNSTFTAERSAAFAARVEREAGPDSVAQVQHAYRLALSRSPARDELSEAQRFVAEFGLASLCRALLNSNEFLDLP